MSDPLHPDGRCSCIGEGRCDFCRRCAAEIALDEALARVAELTQCLTRCGLIAGMRVDDSPSEIADRVEARASRLGVVDIVFDGPPSRGFGQFVEVEDSSGKSINLGEWVERADGYWVLRLTAQRGEGESDGR